MRELVEDAFLSMQGDLRKSIRKMKHKDAIKEIKELCKAICIEPTEEKCSKCSLTVAIECIEKQIPKKVIPNEFGGYYCPGCKAFWATKYGNFIDTNYCPNCGQAVDWSE